MYFLKSLSYCLEMKLTISIINDTYVYIKIKQPVIIIFYVLKDHIIP